MGSADLWFWRPRLYLQTYSVEPLQIEQASPQLSEGPSPLGRGCPAPALSPAVAGRVRGLLLSPGQMENLPRRPRVGTLKPTSWIRKSFGPALFLATAVLFGSASSGERPKAFKSPDAKLTAVVTAVDKIRGLEKYESRISILRSGGVQLSMHDFSSEDGEHGYGVDGAQWTPDSQYFVSQMRNSGGHSPMYAPVVFWSRKTNHFYQLNDYTADLMFSVAAPDEVHVNSWPSLEPATVPLGAVKEGQVTELR